MLKGFLKKAGKKILIFFAPWLLLGLVILFVVGNMLELFQSLTNAINGAVAWAKDTGAGVMSGLEDWWDTTVNGDGDLTEGPYETLALNRWNGAEGSGGPTDPNMTAIIHATMKKHKDRKDAGGEIAESEKAIADAWDQFNSADHTMLSSDDVRKFLNHAHGKSDHMFEMVDAWYQYKKWGLEELPNPAGGDPVEGRWYVEPVAACTSDEPYVSIDDGADMIYKNLSRVKIEGEASSVDGDDREFAPIWQDYLALAGMVAFDKGRNKDDKIGNGNKWGHGMNQSASPTEYDNGNGTAGDSKGAASVNNVENYFLTKKEREKIWNVFDYQFNYENGWDGVAKVRGRHDTKATAFMYDMDADKLSAGGKIGYRFKYKHSDYQVGDVISLAAQPEEMPYTKYIPESAPVTIHNGWKAYNYVYVPTAYIPAEYGGWEGRTEPPDGLYCLGRWNFENPVQFIMAMAELTGYYEHLSGNEYWSEHHVTDTEMGDGNEHHEGDDEDVTYAWEAEMMEQFAMYLDMLEIDNGSEGLTGRRAYYTDLYRRYKDRKLTISYEGTGHVDAYTTGEMRADFEQIKEKCFETIEKEYAEHYKRIGKSAEEAEELARAERQKWEQANEDLPLPSEEQGVTDYIKVNDNLDNVPFYSYGVIFGNPAAGGDPAEGTDPGDYFYDNSDITTVGWFWISQHPYKGKPNEVHQEFHYYEGSCADLRMTGGSRYTKEQLAQVLSYIDGRASNGITFNTPESVDAIYNYGIEKQVDMVGILAIIITEGGEKTQRGREAWNFFNIKAGSDGPRYNGTEWRDFTADCSSAGEALTKQCGWIADKYINSGQHNYLLMQFNKYATWPGGTSIHGPQNEDEADQADIQCYGHSSNPHCFCPWYDDTGYITSHFNDLKAWCNQNGAMYMKMREFSGIRSNESDTNGSIDPKYLQGDGIRAEILRIANDLIGTPYLKEGSTPDGFDCSGFVKWCYEHAGYTGIQRGSIGQWGQGRQISESELKPGDLVFFQGTQSGRGPGVPSHVGIYCGDGNMVHCGNPCHVSNLATYTKHIKLLGYRNLID